MHPVERVSREVANENLRQWGLILPTEAQWEYTARANNSFLFAGTNEASDLAQFANISGREGGSIFANHDRNHEDDFVVHAPIGSLKPNAFGIHDLSGNVTEWVREHAVAYSLTPANPEDGFRPSNRTGNMARGGSFNERIAQCRTTKRWSFAANNSSGTCGVRPSRALEP